MKGRRYWARFIKHFTPKLRPYFGRRGISDNSHGRGLIHQDIFVFGLFGNLAGKYTTSNHGVYFIHHGVKLRMLYSSCQINLNSAIAQTSNKIRSMCPFCQTFADEKKKKKKSNGLYSVTHDANPPFCIHSIGYQLHCIYRWLLVPQVQRVSELVMIETRWSCLQTSARRIHTACVSPESPPEHTSVPALRRRLQATLLTINL